MKEIKDFVDNQKPDQINKQVKYKDRYNQIKT